MNTDNRKHWPVAYRTQREAQIPEGDFREEVQPKHWCWFAVLFVVIVFGPAVPDLLEWML